MDQAVSTRDELVGLVRGSRVMMRGADAGDLPVPA